MTTTSQNETIQSAEQRVITKLTAYLKDRNVHHAELVAGPNGDFISAKDAEDKVLFTMPVGKRSQAGNLTEMNVLITPDKNNPNQEVAIATMNNYETLDTITL